MCIHLSPWIDWQLVTFSKPYECYWAKFSDWWYVGEVSVWVITITEIKSEIFIFSYFVFPFPLFPPSSFLSPFSLFFFFQKEIIIPMACYTFFLKTLCLLISWCADDFSKHQDNMPSTFCKNNEENSCSLLFPHQIFTCLKKKAGCYQDICFSICQGK